MVTCQLIKLRVFRFRCYDGSTCEIVEWALRWALTGPIWALLGRRTAITLARDCQRAAWLAGRLAVPRS